MLLSWYIANWVKGNLGLEQIIEPKRHKKSPPVKEGLKKE
jgi:hypothetical protein